VDQDEYLGAGLFFQDCLEIQNLTRPSSHAVKQSLIKWVRKQLLNQITLHTNKHNGLNNQEISYDHQLNQSTYEMTVIYRLNEH
jgi:hypothetical protein